VFSFSPSSSSSFLPPSVPSLLLCNSRSCYLVPTFFLASLCSAISVLPAADFLLFTFTCHSGGFPYRGGLSGRSTIVSAVLLIVFVPGFLGSRH
jgi:hypothetical protein